MVKRYTRRTFAFEIAMLIAAAIFCLPLYLLVTVALKPGEQLFTSPLKFPIPPYWGNFSTAWNPTGVSNGLGHAMISSVIITFSSVAGLIVIGSLCAYVIARRPGKMSSALYYTFVLGIIIPFQLSIIPLYVVFHKLGLIGSYLGMIVLWIGIGMPLTVFLYTGFIRTVPREYEEAARVDGASTARIYTQIVFPLLMPVTGTVAILLGLFIWNDFFVSLIYLSGSANETIPVVIYSFVGQYLSQWQDVFAAIILALLPVVIFFVLTQKHMIRGFSGGIRG
jgi:raffinose/stachyose/melibiose transport system permease protein